jgi:hypothetical protein
MMPRSLALEPERSRLSTQRVGINATTLTFISLDALKEE